MTAKCVNHKRCGNQAKGPRARYCAQCFRDNAARKGSLSSGNAKGKGSLGNAGNVQTGSVKKRAGERSGVRRSAKSALVVKKRWLDKILADVGEPRRPHREARLDSLRAKRLHRQADGSCAPGWLPSCQSELLRARLLPPLYGQLG